MAASGQVTRAIRETEQAIEDAEALFGPGSLMAEQYRRTLAGLQKTGRASREPPRQPLKTPFGSSGESGIWLYRRSP